MLDAHSALAIRLLRLSPRATARRDRPARYPIKAVRTGAECAATASGDSDRYSAQILARVGCCVESGHAALRIGQRGLNRMTAPYEKPVRWGFGRVHAGLCRNTFILFISRSLPWGTCAIRMLLVLMLLFTSFWRHEVTSLLTNTRRFPKPQVVCIIDRALVKFL